MRYDNPELIRQLAAEYVIGTLQGPARKRFEALLAVNAEARFQRDFWEQRLSEFGQALRPVAPPQAIRDRVLNRTGAPQPASPRVARPSSRRRRRAWWSYAAGFATAAGLVAAFLLGQHHSQPAVPGAMPPLAMHVPDSLPDARSIYAAQMRMPASSMGWLLSITEDHDRLIAVAAEDLLQVGRHRLHLWCLVPGGEPISLGDLPVERHASAEFNIPKAVRGHDQVSFVVTLEPQQRRAQAGPEGPVMHEALSMTDF